MSDVRYYDPAERQREKERSRAFDAAQLSQGAVSQGELRQRNGFFSSLEILDASISCQEVFA
jgi:hypothetical protein